MAENRVGRVEHSASLHIYGTRGKLIGKSIKNNLLIELKKGSPYVRAMSTVIGVGGKRLELPCPVAGYPIEGITWEKGQLINLIWYQVD